MLQKILGIFKHKSKHDTTQNQDPKVNAIESTKNWYLERYDNIIVQRNILFILVVLFVLFAVSAVGTVAYIVKSRKFDPFVIQIDNSTGMATIVTPLTTDVLGRDEALTQYFIRKYLTARETYNSVNYAESQKIVNLLSSRSVYSQYRNLIASGDPSVKYGENNSTYLEIHSAPKIGNNKYFITFSITEIAGNKNVYNKSVYIEYNYVSMELNDDDQDINPVGFQVTGYYSAENRGLNDQD